MKNRESLYPGRVKLTPVDAANGIYDLVRADEPQDPGTPLNKKLLDFAVAACGVAAGTATAYTLDDEFGGFELVDGAKVSFRLHVASGVNPTLNVNGTGAKPLVDAFGEAMQPEAAAGSWITATYSADIDSYTVGVMKYQEIVFPRRPDIIDIIDTADGSYQIDVPLSKEYKKYSINLIDANSALRDLSLQFIWTLILTGISAQYVYITENVITYNADVTANPQRLHKSSGTTTSFSLMTAEITAQSWTSPAEVNVEIVFVNGNCYIKTIVEVEQQQSDPRITFEKTILIHNPTIGNMKLTWQRPSNQTTSYHNKHMMIIKGEK